ncbi:hypothetical protein RhiirA4_432215, partial [Rhizophagus irregularis]
PLALEGACPSLLLIFTQFVWRYLNSSNYILRNLPNSKYILTVKCSIEYMEKRPLYKICFGDNFAREVHSWKSLTDAACKYYQEFNKTKEIGKNQNRNQSNRKNKGKISGPLLFGLKLLSVE